MDLDRKLSRWGVLYFWVPIINQELLPYDLFFDKLICVKKSGAFIYSGYFTVGYSAKSDVEFCQLIVQFDEKGRLRKKRLLTWKQDYGVITLIPKNMLILDNRANFPFLENKLCQLS